MKFETISFVLEKKEEIDEVRQALVEFKNEFPQAKLGKPKFGELSKKIIITFKVENGYASELIKIFTMHYIKVLTTTNEIKKKVFEATSSYVKALAKQDKGWDELKIEQPEMSVSELEVFARKGNYEEVIRIAGDLFHYGETIVEKARDVLDISLQKAIEKAVKDAEKSPELVGKSISELIKMASNRKVKSYDKINIMRQAGLSAVIIAKNNPKYHYELIKITNNTHLDNFINVSAFIALGEIVMPNPEKFSLELDSARKLLNLRWLEIAYDVAEKLLDSTQQKKFNEFMKFLKEKRSEKPISSGTKE